jgi:hypothetical protein
VVRCLPGAALSGVGFQPAGKHWIGATLGIKSLSQNQIC